MRTTASDPPPQPRPRITRCGHRLLAIALAATLVTTAPSACSNDRPHQDPGGKVKPAARAQAKAHATVTTSPQTPEQTVVAAYRHAKEVYLDALLDPWHVDGRVGATRVDPSLSQVNVALERKAREGVVVRYPNGQRPTIAVDVVHIDGRSAELRVCEVDDSVQVEANSGAVIDDDVISESYVVEMAFIRGVWKVRSQTSLNEWPDGRGCTR